MSAIIVEVHNGYLDNTTLSERVIGEMKKVDRKIFIGDEYEDELVYSPISALPIICGQTCSEPAMVAHMANKLKLNPGQNILNVGTGCGYADALHLLLISPCGTLVTIERHANLLRLARENLVKWYDSLSNDEAGNSKKYYARVKESTIGFDIEFIIYGAVTQAKLRYGSASQGYLPLQPYDRIVLTAGVPENFDDSMLLGQLQKNGILLFPDRLGQMHLVVKEYPINRVSYGTVSFVPLIP